MKKNFLIIFLLALLCSLASCKKSQEELIIGSWIMDSVTITPEVDLLHSVLTGSTYTLNADKSVVFSALDGLVSGSGTYSVSDNKISATVILLGSPMSMEFLIRDLKGDHMTVQVEQMDIMDELGIDALVIASLSRQ